MLGLVNNIIDFKSLKSNIIAKVSLLFLVTIFFVSSFAFISANKTLKNAAISRLQVAAKLKEDSLRVWLGNLETDLLSISQLEMIKNLAHNNLGTKFNDSTIIDNIRSYLKRLQNNKQDWQEIFILDENGRIVVSTESKRENDYRTFDEFFINGLNKKNIQKIYPSPITFGPTITISAPLENKFDEVVGVIAMHVNLNRIDKVILEETGLGNAGESYLVDQYKAFVSSARFGREKFLRGVDSFAINQAVSGISGSALYSNYAGIPVIGSYLWADEIGAALIVELPQEIALKPARELALNIIVFGLITLVVLVWIIYLFAGRITTPLVQLATSVDKAAGGNFKEKVEVASLDEIGRLAKSYNLMLSQLHASYSQLSMEKNRAEEATKAKSQFISNMSHEIRTPINSVIGYSQLLAKRSDLSSETKDYVNRIIYSGNHLLELINTLLDISKIESGKSEIIITDFSLVELTRELTSMFEFRCSEKDLIWKSNSEISDEWVKGDRLKLKQVLINLINNAIKFTDSGNVQFLLRQVGEGQFHFEIQDTGKGIAEEAQKTIFKPFEQEFESHQTAGSGLGLAISNRLVEIMGGELEVRSISEKGSQFYFSIPLAVCKPLKTERKKPQQEPSLTKGDVALVVDDQPDNIIVLKACLQDIGLTVLSARNGQEAVDTCMRLADKNKNLDYIFMDIRMPVMDGITAYKIISKIEFTHSPKCFAVSASTLAHEKNEIMSIGFDGFIPKPVNFEDVEMILSQEAIKQHNQTKEQILSSSIKLSPQTIKKALQACKVYHISELNECINEIEAQGNEGARVAQQLRTLLKMLNMNRISELISQME